MSSSISRVTLSSLESQCRNAIRSSSEIKFCTSSLWHFLFWGCTEIMAPRGKWCARGLRCMCYFIFLKYGHTVNRSFQNRYIWKVLWGRKRHLSSSEEANCSTTSILFIAMWMFLLTAHLCADWAVKILSSCSEWTESHIQGHYALGVRKIKHQIKADLGPFNRLSWTQRSQPCFFSLEMEQFPGTFTVMHYNVWVSTVISALIRETSMATV